MLFLRNGQQWLVHTPAKLNLYLEIIGRRDDGYHQLETCMVSVDLFDTLRFRPLSDDLAAQDHKSATRGTISLTVRSPAGITAPADQTNLVWQAATALQRHTGCTRGASIELCKRIPTQAGLGGGSSDAAATLVALNALWELRVSKTELHEVAASLGSDLNFFIEQTTAAVCQGRGEIVTPITHARRMHFVIGCPPIGLSTADVFNACSLPTQPASIKEFREGFEQGRIRPQNRLAEAAVRSQPELGAVAKAFEQVCPGLHQLTGSGSAWFGIAASRRAALRGAQALRSAGLLRTFAVSSCV